MFLANEVFFISLVFCKTTIQIFTILSTAALEKAISLCVDGADVSTICGQIDDFILEEL
jgi:hypothetical protein